MQTRHTPETPIPQVNPNTGTVTPGWPFRHISKFSYESFEGVCSDMENGMSLRKACAKANMPTKDLYYWSERDEHTARRFALARRVYSHNCFHKVAESADQLADTDYWLAQEPKPGMVAATALDKGARLLLDVAKRLNPAEYGDKTQTQVTVDGQVTVATAVDSKLTEFLTSRPSIEQAEELPIIDGEFEEIGLE